MRSHVIDYAYVFISHEFILMSIRAMYLIRIIWSVTRSMFGGHGSTFASPVIVSVCGFCYDL